MSQEEVDRKKATATEKRGCGVHDNATGRVGAKAYAKALAAQDEDGGGTAGVDSSGGTTMDCEWNFLHI